MIRLNKQSYVHVKIRLYCHKLEQESGMKLIINLDEEFEELYFANALSYIRIDYNNNLCFAMSHKLTKKEMELIKDIVLECNTVEWANRLSQMQEERILKEKEQELQKKREKRKKK